MTDDISLKTHAIDPTQASQLANMAAAGQAPALHINNFLVMQADGDSLRIVFSESIVPGVPSVARCSVVLKLEAANELATVLDQVLDQIVAAAEAEVAAELDNQPESAIVN